MKLLFKTLLIYFIILNIVLWISYLSMSFIAIDFDFRNWSHNKRALIVGVLLAYIGFTPLILQWIGDMIETDEILKKNRK